MLQPDLQRLFHGALLLRFIQRNGGDFVCGNDSLSAVQIQWGEERRTEKRKIFPFNAR
jgi:hypothetical protein